MRIAILLAVFSRRISTHRLQPLDIGLFSPLRDVPLTSDR